MAVVLNGSGRDSQKGVMINRKKAQRPYWEEVLAMRRRRSRKRAVGTRAPTPLLTLPNQDWNLDFVNDQMASGWRARAQFPVLLPSSRSKFRLWGWSDMTFRSSDRLLRCRRRS